LLWVANSSGAFGSLFKTNHLHDLNLAHTNLSLSESSSGQSPMVALNSVKDTIQAFPENCVMTPQGTCAPNSGLLETISNWAITCKNNANFRDHPIFSECP
jgi:hypothetical protein